MLCSALRGSTRGQVGVCSSPSSHKLYVSHFLQLDDHFFDALTARTCNGHPLPCSGTNASVCVSEEDAASVFAIGDFEYECVFPCPLFHQFNNSLQLTSYIWHAAQNASTYASLTFGALPFSTSLSFRQVMSSTNAGAFFAELADALAAPAFAHRLALHVGHDGSMVRLLAGLGAFPLRWPAFGAEVVFEVRPPVSCPIFNVYLLCPSQVWEVVGVRFVRVFHDGTVLNGLEWVQLDEFVGRLRALVPNRLFEQCMGD